MLSQPSTNGAHLVAPDVRQIVAGLVIGRAAIVMVPLQPRRAVFRKDLHLAVVWGARAMPCKDGDPDNAPPAPAPHGHGHDCTARQNRSGCARPHCNRANAKNPHVESEEVPRTAFASVEENSFSKSTAVALQCCAPLGRGEIEACVK